MLPISISFNKHLHYVHFPQCAVCVSVSLRGCDSQWGVICRFLAELGFGTMVHQEELERRMEQMIVESAKRQHVQFLLVADHQRCGRVTARLCLRPFACSSSWPSTLSDFQQSSFVLPHAFRVCVCVRQIWPACKHLLSQLWHQTLGHLACTQCRQVQTIQRCWRGFVGRRYFVQMRGAAMDFQAKRTKRTWKEEIELVTRSY